ncbi:hypothetical protein D3C84_1057180 [compost metagenome]
MQTNIDFFLLCSQISLRFRTNVKADYDSVGCSSQVNIGFSDRTYAAVNDFNTNAFDFNFRKGAFERLCRALNVRLDNDVEIFDLAFLNMLEQVVKRNTGISAKL